MNMNASQKAILHVFDEHVFGAMHRDLDWALRGAADNLAALGLVAYTDSSGDSSQEILDAMARAAVAFGRSYLTLVPTMRAWRSKASISTNASAAASRTNTSSKASRRYGVRHPRVAESFRVLMVRPTSSSRCTATISSVVFGSYATRYSKIKAVRPSRGQRRHCLPSESRYRDNREGRRYGHRTCCARPGCANLFVAAKRE